MKILRLLILAGLALSSAWPLAAQNRHCATQEMWQHKADADPAYALRRAASEARNQAWISQHPDVRKTASVVTIPVVVHVVYNNSTENISNAQIQSQIDALNLDYRLLNSDSLPDTHPFWVNTADCEIEFCLASVDPNGNSTTGITRTSTSHGQFVNAGADDIKFTNSGGHDNWDPTHYLNIWVGDIGNSLYGYATFPSDLAASPEYDGVVINYTAFGTMGTAQSPADLGRTATHEIGHWLDLSHIWGDQFCGDDLVNDTEPAEDANYGCFNFPHNANNSCGAGPNGEMYMNYMDYTDDNCMAMFTFGQKSRMYAALNGDRSEMLHSGGCLSTAAPTAALTGRVTMYPNPSTGKVVIESGDFSPKTNLTVVNALGHVVLQQDRIGGFPYSLDLSSLPGDIYFVKLSDGRHLHTQKIVLTH